VSVTELRPEANREALRRDRWQPVRAGILNVWRYYDEVLHFHRGRLLLRGPNGTGKSKALEVLLPFLFDASLRPERLSTFRGTERTMHWNLMGDGYSNASRVGYVWMEFGRQGDDGDTRWFTCGARLQAAATSRSVTPTYFTTTVRVGVPGGISLVKDGNVPLTVGDLTAALGTTGDVHDVGRYRRTVRETLFRGFTEDQYVSLINALLQLRTPKLSEHLDPDHLSGVLSEALPPLDSQDIAEIAEGFEKLDRRHEDLQRLDQEVAAAERLATRQRTYARRVLRRSAAELVSATTQLDNVTREARQARTSLDQALAEQEALTANLAELEQRAGETQGRITGLHDSDAYRHGLQLDKLRQDAERAQTDAERSRVRAERFSSEASDEGVDVERRRRAAEEASAAAGRALVPARTLAVQVGVEAAFERALSAEPEPARSLIRAGIESRERQVVETRRAIDGHEQALREQRGAERRFTERQREVDAAEELLTARRQEQDAALQTLREDIAAWVLQCVELSIASRAADLADLAEEEQTLAQAIGEAVAQAREAFTRQESAIREELDGVLAELATVEAERDRLLANGMVEPTPPEWRTADRTGRPGAPLWRLLDWREHVEGRTQAGIEAALQAAGLLDAWVLPDGSVSAGEHDAYLEAALSSTAPGPSLADLLVVDAGSPVHPERLQQLLRGIAVGDTAPEHVAAVGVDGTWRLASAHGSWSKPDAVFLGTSARERARQRRLAELAAAIVGREEAATSLRSRLEALDRRRQVLAIEAADRPSHRPYLDAVRRADQAGSAVASRRDLRDAARRERDDADEAVTAAAAELTLVASRHGLPATRSALDQFSERLSACRNSTHTWLDARLREIGALEQAAAAVARSARSRQQADEAEAEAAEKAARVTVVDAELSAVESAVGTEYRNVLDEVRDLRRQLQELADRRTRETKRQLGLGERVGGLRKALAVVESQREQAAGQRDGAAGRFRRLGDLSLGADARVRTVVAERATTSSALQAARQVAEELASVPFEPAHLKDAESRLAETMYEIRQSLAGRVDLALEPDADLDAQVATAAVDGLRISPGELADRLRSERDEARRQLTEEERELFDRTLTGDVRRHVADRIRHADGLVRSMNAQLERVRTASAVRVRLQWEVDPELAAGLREARALLLRDPATLSDGERHALHEFFRGRIEEVRAAGTATGWEDQLMRVLDYRAWHRFAVHLRRGDAEPVAVTRRQHGALSGGEKAIVLHLPLFAAVSAHYLAAPGAPRLILLDEVFVGVDQTNRGQLLDLLGKLDLDMTLTSDHEWCTYAEVDGIAIHQLLTDPDDQAVTTARFVWDGTRLASADVDTAADA
jgi:uncharacterized protein (TIGR02680 family)